MNRRTFVTMLGGTAVVAASARPARAGSANDTLLVGVMGTGGQGRTLATLFAGHANTEVVAVADVDMDRAAQASLAVGKVEGVTRAPKPVQDFRVLLDDKRIDVLVVATCNHWHAPATILGCSAGKHVYVEKPCSHNPWEGETMVAAARRFDRRVQMGNQRRTWERCREAIAMLRDGAIGRVYHASSFYDGNRPGIGRGKAATPPATLDYDLWQGPAPRREFRDNYLHYNWHWFWHWGNGELGNNGVHGLDICRWGLGVDHPVQVSSTGGRFRWQDDQETPDTNLVTFTFEDGRSASWEGLSCSRRPKRDGRPAPEVVFHGENGTLVIASDGFTIHDENGKEVRNFTDPDSRKSSSHAAHTGNFLDAIRTGVPLTSEIEEGHRSTMLCHLGNISYRTGRTLRCDPRSGRILGDDEAMRLWKRQYEPGWEPTI